MTQNDEIKAAQFMLLDRVENTSAVSQLLRENKIIVQERNFLTALVYNEANLKVLLKTFLYRQFNITSS